MECKKRSLIPLGYKGENLEDMSLFGVCVAFSITKVERKAANYCGVESG